MTASLALSDDEVHVWHAALGVDARALDELGRLLAPDERDRADRFRFERDRRRYVAARGRLRTLLGAYLGCPAASVRIDYGASGKPAVGRDPAAPDIRFNVSHSGDRALYAVCLGREVGVDIEEVRPELATTLAWRWLSSDDVAALEARDPEARVAAFFSLWVRREALLKARGVGLTVLAEDQGRSTHGGMGSVDPVAVDRWHVADLDAGPGYAAALAVEGGELRLRSGLWPAGRFPDGALGEDSEGSARPDGIFQSPRPGSSTGPRGGTH